MDEMASDPNMFVCQSCNKVCTTALQLRKHIYHHNRTRNHVCNTCGIGFNAKSRLLAHELTHSNVKSFACEECDARFKQRSSLNRHMTVHKDDIKPVWQCFTCGKIFSSKTCLMQHEKYRHSSKRPFCCETCGSAFKTPKELSRHKDSHSETPNFECTLCTKRFRVKDNLRKHIKYCHAPSEIKREMNRKRYLEKKRRKHMRDEDSNDFNLDTNMNERDEREGQNKIKIKPETGSNNKVDSNTEVFNGVSSNDRVNRARKVTETHSIESSTYGHGNTSIQDLEILGQSDGSNECQIVVKNEATEKECQSVKQNKIAKEGLDNQLIGDCSDIKLTHSNEKEQPTVEGLMDWADMINECQIEKPAAECFGDNATANNEIMPHPFSTRDKNHDLQHGNKNNQMHYKCGNAKGNIHGLSLDGNVDNLNNQLIPKDVDLVDEDEPPVILVNTDTPKSKDNEVIITPKRKYKEFVIVEKLEMAAHDGSEIYKCELCNVKFKFYDTIVMHLEHIHGITDNE